MVLKLIPNSYPWSRRPAVGTLKIHIIVLKFVSRSHPYILKMHIMIHKLIPRSQTSPYTFKIFKKDYELFQIFRISNQVLISLKIDKKNHDNI